MAPLHYIAKLNVVNKDSGEDTVPQVGIDSDWSSIKPLLSEHPKLRTLPSIRLPLELFSQLNCIK